MFENPPMKKDRIPIPENISAKVLFLSDRTCCKCNIPGMPIQIHHIDENPANNIFENLAVLCLICHDETMSKGGFGRKLDAAQVILYRDSWNKRILERKQKADEIASINSAIGLNENKTKIDFEDNLDYKHNYDRNILQKYLDKINIIHNAQQAIAQTKFDEGIHSETLKGIYDMVDFYEEVLIEISTFYPRGHFNKVHPKIYYNDLIASKFLWHRLILEPGGVGTGGWMISEIAGGNVMNDLMELVIQIVRALIFPYSIVGINIEKWEETWRG